jgi:pimeloyl-ACP methyl ester carboxylesterase
VPAVVLLKGTGPQDRDGNNEVGHSSLHRAMAEHLAAHGVASLRCDTRGYGGSTGRFWDATFGTYVTDAHAMIEALRRTSSIDGRRIGIVAHSEGGVVGPEVADEDPGVRAMVLVGAAGRPFLEGVLWQTRDELRRAHAPEDKIAAAVEGRRAVLGVLAAGGPLPEGLPAADREDIAPMVPWLKSRLAHDTRAQNRRLRHLPILIVQGGHDLSTPAEDADLLKADFRAGHNPDAEAALCSDLGHSLIRARIDEERPTGPIDDEALERIATFVAQRLASPDGG